MDSQSRESSNPFFVFDISKVCATCTKHIESRSYSLDTPIDKTANVNLYQVLESQLQFKGEDNGPSNLCPECFSKALLFYEFYQQYKKSVILFNKYVKYQTQFTTMDVTNVGEQHDVNLTVAPEQVWISDSTLVKVKDEYNDLDEDETIENDTSCDTIQQSISPTTEVTPKCNKTKTNQSKLYKCTLCDAVYNKHQSFAYHRNVHNKKFVCSYCGKAVGSKYLLGIHERGHNGEQPYPCGKCDKKFNSNSELQQHLASHAKKRPFKCEVCQKSYKSKSVLRRHMSIHTGSKQHECPKCNRSFVYAFNLKRHLQALHPQE